MYKYLIPSESNIISTIHNSPFTEVRNSLLNLIVWNVYKAQKKSFANDFKELIKNTDFFLIQEYHSLLSEFENIDNDRDIVKAISFYINADITGISTISKYKCIDSNYIRPQVLEPLLKTPKLCLITKYSSANKIIKIINVHAINFVTKNKFIKFIKEIEEELDSINETIILAGDFNTWNKQRTNILKELAIKYNLEEVMFINDKRILKLDYIFVKNIQIKQAKLLNEIISSDHKPLYIEFNL